MTLPQIYQYLFLLLATVMTLVQYKKYKIIDYNYNTYNPQQYGLIVLIIIVSFIIGLRPMDMGLNWADSGNYNKYYIMHEGESFSFDTKVDNLIWDNFFMFWACHSLGINSLFIICDLIYFGGTYFACKKIFKNDTTAAYSVFLAAFSTYSASYNAVKAGMAGAWFLLAIAYYKNKKISFLFLILSFGFHHSMQMPIAVYFLTLFIKKPKWYFYGWGLSVLIAFAHISTFQTIFASMSDSTGSSYLASDGSEEGSYLTGFRPDFILYSAAPVVIGYILILKKKLNLSEGYITLLNMYLGTNAIWMLCMYASYSNRIAYLSWFMYPLVLIHPYLREKLYPGQYKMFAKIMVCHLSFTLFMEVIYYTIIHPVG